MIFSERNKSKQVLRVYQFLQFHAVKLTARSGHDRASGKRHSIFFAVASHSQWIFLPWPQIFRTVYSGGMDKLMSKGLYICWFYESSVSLSVCHS